MANRPTVAALPDMADIPRQSLEDPRFRRLLYAASEPVSVQVAVLPIIAGIIAIPFPLVFLFIRSYTGYLI